MLINCAAYQDGRKEGDITVEAISDYLLQPDCFVWVALRDATEAEISLMEEEFTLHPLAVEDARHGHQRPKLEEYGETLFCVLHMLEMDEAGEILVGEVDIFVGHNFVLSLRNRTETNFLNVRQRCEREPHLLQYGAGFVLYALMDAVVDRYFEIVHRLQDELDSIEQKTFEQPGSARKNLQALYILKRKLVTVNHAAVPLQEAIAHLYGGRVPAVCHEMQAYFRDVNDHLERIVKSVESLRDMLATTIQVNLAMISLDASEISKKLAAYAALFAVPTMIAGVYGMNFEHMPELKSHFGYPAALAVMFVLDLVIWIRFRRAGWV